MKSDKLKDIALAEAFLKATKATDPYLSDWRALLPVADNHKFKIPEIQDAVCRLRKSFWHDGAPPSIANFWREWKSLKEVVDSQQSKIKSETK